MSLAQHVSVIDGVDRPPVEAIPAGQQETAAEAVRRVLSYDAFPPSHSEGYADNIAPYHVSTARRAVQVILTAITCWLASGIVFGFAAIKPVFIAEGVYRDLCTDEELLEDINVCFEQDIRLNFMFVMASITANVSALPVGAVLDRYGPRVCGVAGSFFIAAGSILMSYSFALEEFDGYLMSNFLLALGGTFIFIPSFQIANAFPKYSGSIVALITGSFDASAAVFLFYRLTYEATDHAFAPDKFFLLYTVVPMLIFVVQITLLPSQSYHTLPQLEQKIDKAYDATRDFHDSDDQIGSDAELRRIRRAREDRRLSKIQRLDDILGDEDERQQRFEREEELKTASVVYGILHGQSARKQMLSPWFILITLLTVVQMLRMNYFIATIHSQYEYILDSESQADAINLFFDVALPAGGVICTPFIGLFLDNLSVYMSLAVIVSLTTVIGVLNSLPVVWAAYATVCLFVTLRPLYYSAMSDYAAKVFGFATFGRVYGTIICLSGIVNFAQYGIDVLTLGPFHGNPTPVNIIMAGTGLVVGSVLVVFVWRNGKAFNGNPPSEFDEAERERLLPENGRLRS